MSYRRIFLSVLVTLAFAVCAQDTDWVRGWEETQRSRPRDLGAVGRIASASEPGTPMIVHGRIFQRDGVSPAPGITLFAYQTDATGVYNTGGRKGWRLRGWARSDAEGRFELRTIRPGSYPGGRVPAHIHLTIEGPDLPRRWTEEVRFADDPFVSASEKQAAVSKGKFAAVRTVSKRGGVEHVDVALRISDQGRF